MLVYIFWYIWYFTIFLRRGHHCSPLSAPLSDFIFKLRALFQEVTASSVGPDGCWYMPWNTIRSSAPTEALSLLHWRKILLSATTGIQKWRQIDKQRWSVAEFSPSNKWDQSKREQTMRIRHTGWHCVNGLWYTATKTPLLWLPMQQLTLVPGSFLFILHTVVKLVFGRVT